METLFSNNIYILYILVGFSVFSLPSFEEYQRVILFYVISFMSGLLNIIPVRYILLLSVSVMFFMTEYFSCDKSKRDIILRVHYKLLDFLYCFTFLYHIALYIVALMLVFFSHIASHPIAEIFWALLAVGVMFLNIQIVSKRKFKVFNLHQLSKKLERFEINNLMLTPAMQTRFEILALIEDKTFFTRVNAYTPFTVEFLKIKLRQLSTAFKRKKSLKNFYADNLKYMLKSISRRGYSTLEMQLIRTLAIERGWDCVIRRKFYEIFYSPIFFSSYYDKFDTYYYRNTSKFRMFLLYVYCHTVHTWIGGKKQRFCDWFEESDIGKWELEKMLVASVGLNSTRITKDNIDRYAYIIETYQLDRERILAISGGNGSNA